MVESSRLEELRRRVAHDPASIAFAALAEEYRKAGQLAEAIETCRTGLQRHPTYTSARVTLARALSDLGERDAAADEFERVLKAAPENLAARRGLAEIQRRQGDIDGALANLRMAALLAPQDTEIREKIDLLEAGTAGVESAAARGLAIAAEPPPGAPPPHLALVADDLPSVAPPALAEPVDLHPDSDVPTQWRSDEDLVRAVAPGADAVMEPSEPMRPIAGEMSASGRDDAAIARLEQFLDAIRRSRALRDQ